MARENQGLQIALIASVMLTVILAGTTYYWYRQYDDAETKAKSNLADAGKKAQLAAENANDVTKLKKAIGLAETDKVDAFETNTFKEDMAKFGAGLAEEELAYRRLLTKQQETINKKNAEVEDFKNQVQGLHAQIKTFEANKQPQIDDFQKARDAAAQDLAGERTKFNSDRERTNQEAAKLLADVQNVRKEVTAEKAKGEAQATEAGVAKRKLMDVVDRQATEIEKMTSTKIDSFDGEIRWVDQRTRSCGSTWAGPTRCRGKSPSASTRPSSPIRAAPAARRPRSKSRTSSAITWPRPASSKIRFPTRSFRATRSTRRCGAPARRSTLPWPASWTSTATARATCKP